MHRRGERGSILVDLLLTGALFLGGLLMICGLAVLGYGYYNANRIFPGITIQGVPVGGLLPEQAVARLEQALIAQELPYVSLQTPEREWIHSTVDLGGSLELRPAVREAWEMGRSGVFRQDLLTRARLLWQGYDIVPAFQLEPGLSLTPLRQIARQTGYLPQRTHLSVAGLQVHGDAAHSGRDLDMATSQDAIVDAVREALGDSGWNAEPRWLRARYNRPPRTSYFPVDPIPVPLAFNQVILPLAEVSESRQIAETILSASVTLTFDATVLNEGTEDMATRQTWTVDRAMLGDWLVVQPDEADPLAEPEVTVDPSKVRALIDDIAQTIERPVRQGRFGYDPHTATLEVLSPEQYGLALDREATVDAFLAASQHPENRTVALSVRRIVPAVTHQQLEDLLPLELISVGETSFAGSTEARLQNIVVATAEFEGRVVAPQSLYSMIADLGLVTLANGYTESWVIYGNQTLLGPGGGVCQVATTFFRAAFWGGYPIVERTPHAYRVSWYEPPVGLDAAVFTPWVDVKFQNDTDTPIVIMTEVDRAAGKLYFRFYGRSPGRQVTIEGPVLQNPSSPGPPVVEIDPTLAPGQRVEVERARNGIEVTVYRIIEVDGQQIARERFFSDYQAWPARYREGPQPEGTARGD